MAKKSTQGNAANQEPDDESVVWVFLGLCTVLLFFVVWLNNEVNEPRVSSKHSVTYGEIRSVWTLAKSWADENPGLRDSAGLVEYVQKYRNGSPLVDGWGKPLVIQHGETLVVSSAGEDGEWNTDDDLSYAGQ